LLLGSLSSATSYVLNMVFSDEGIKIASQYTYKPVTVDKDFFIEE
jgi:hypothetical protein